MSQPDSSTTAAAVSRTGGRGRYFGQYSLRHRVLLFQLPLTISAVLITAVVLSVDPGVATGSPHLAIGFGGILLLTVLAGVVPWHRLPPVAYWVIPLLDFVAIAPFWAASREVLDGMSVLAALPVFWLAWSGICPTLAITLGFVGSAAVAWYPYLFDTTPFEVELVESTLMRPAMVPFLMLALGIAASALSTSMDRQSEELRESLEYAASQNRRLHAVVDTSDVGILVVDRDGHDVLMNPAQRRLHFLSLPPGREDGADAELLLFEPDGITPIPPTERPVHRALQGETFEGRMIAAGTDGSQQHLSVSASPLIDEDGAFDGTVMVVQNVTDLIDAIRTREQFVAEVSHEFRTPLTSIIGYLDLALETAPDAELERYLTTSIRNAERLLQLVTSLLEAQASSPEVIVQDVDLARLTRHSLESAEVRARQRGVTVTSALPEHLAARVDPVKIGQVIDNLVSNALKYTPGGGSVTVSLRRLEPGTAGTGTAGTGPAGSGEATGAWAELLVRDTGIGMSEQERSQLFTTFYRADHVRRAAIPGTGLGLAISQRFVRAHGGDILVASQPGAGSTFTVRIPLERP
ncbi:sensor histidine kinase [Brachybacterium sp. UNK5269]|uniref:sensor histidine kinase n=1 Tax=Brachybacterium sp. UNK5269 TaxID=3408576 RepID=UPI003BB00657